MFTESTIPDRTVFWTKEMGPQDVKVKIRKLHESVIVTRFYSWKLTENVFYRNLGEVSDAIESVHCI